MTGKIPWKTIRLWGALLILLGFGVTAGFIFKNRLIENRQRRQFEAVLLEAEDLLKRGAIAQGGELLDSLRRDAGKRPYRAEEYLRLLKRYHLYSRQRKDWTSFLLTAQKAMEDYPGREDLAALGAYGLLREGNLEGNEKAWGRLRDPRFDSLKAEALLRTGNWEDGSPLVPTPFREVLTGREPALFVEAGKKTGLLPFYLDAALLALEGGDREEAQEIHRAHLAGEYPLFSLYLSLDLGDMKGALEYWDQLIDGGGGVGGDDTP